MKETMEKLWNEYFAEKCAVVETKEERALLQKASEIYKRADELLTREQRDAIEEYIDALYEIQHSYEKKAFFKGCEFLISFFLELGVLGE